MKTCCHSQNTSDPKEDCETLRYLNQHGWVHAISCPASSFPWKNSDKTGRCPKEEQTRATRLMVLRILLCEKLVVMISLEASKRCIALYLTDMAGMTSALCFPSSKLSQDSPGQFLRVDFCAILKCLSPFHLQKSFLAVYHSFLETNLNRLSQIVLVYTSFLDSVKRVPFNSQRCHGLVKV